MKKVLLDTNAFSALFKGDNSVFDVIVESERVFVSIFVLGELFTGFKGGKKEKENRKILNDFLSKSSVRLIDATRETAEIFSEIKNKLRLTGTPVPINDIWIAAHVIETGSVLITFDKHFIKIAGLRIWSI